MWENFDSVIACSLFLVSEFNRDTGRQLMYATVEVPCHRCGRLQRRHFSKANLTAICFPCKQSLQKENGELRRRNKRAERVAGPQAAMNS
jgi:hypothetical protein